MPSRTTSSSQQEAFADDGAGVGGAVLDGEGVGAAALGVGEAETAAEAAGDDRGFFDERGAKSDDWLFCELCESCICDRSTKWFIGQHVAPDEGLGG